MDPIDFEVYINWKQSQNALRCIENECLFSVYQLKYQCSQYHSIELVKSWCTANLVVHSKITNRCVSSNTSNATKSCSTSGTRMFVKCMLIVQCSCYAGVPSTCGRETEGKCEQQKNDNRSTSRYNYVRILCLFQIERRKKKYREWKRTKKKREMKTTSVL